MTRNCTAPATKPIKPVAAAEKLGLLSHGYVDLGSAYVFASADALPAVSLVGVSA